MKKVSELLKEEREQKGYSLQDVEKNTRIKKHFLVALEEGRFEDLPSESYALGFIKSYGNFLNLPSQKTAALFRREYEEERRDIIPDFRRNQENFKKRSLINPKNIFIFLIFIILFFYIFFQYSSLLFGPELIVNSPINSQAVKDNIVKVSGKTDPYATVTIDSEEAYVGLDGSFKKTLYLFPGDKEILIIAKNRFGKETRKVINVKVK